MVIREGREGEKAPGSGARERLLAAGTALFSEKGYAGTSIREIVSQAGVTKPVLYYYFENKEGIFLAILKRAARMQEAILADVRERTGAVLDRLIYLYHRIYQGVGEHQQLFKMIHNLIFGLPQGAPEGDTAHYSRRMAEAIKEIYVQGLASGEVRHADPDEAAMMVLALMDFCFHLAYIRPESLDPAQGERLLRLAFQGLSTTEGE